MNCDVYVVSVIKHAATIADNRGVQNTTRFWPANIFNPTCSDVRILLLIIRLFIDFHFLVNFMKTVL